MNDPNMHPFRQLMHSIMGSDKFKHKMYEARLRADWPRLMGKMINDYTDDIQVRNHKLILTISSAPLKQELTASKQKFLNLIHRHIGEAFFKDIVIR